MAAPFRVKLSRLLARLLTRINAMMERVPVALVLGSSLWRQWVFVMVVGAALGMVLRWLMP